MELAGRRRLRRQPLLRQRGAGADLPGPRPAPDLDAARHQRLDRPGDRAAAAHTLRYHRARGDAAGTHPQLAPAPLPARADAQERTRLPQREPRRARRAALDRARRSGGAARPRAGGGGARTGAGAAPGTRAPGSLLGAAGRTGARQHGRDLARRRPRDAAAHRGRGTHRRARATPRRATPPGGGTCGLRLRARGAQRPWRDGALDAVLPALALRFVPLRPSGLGVVLRRRRAETPRPERRGGERHLPALLGPGDGAGHGGPRRTLRGYGRDHESLPGRLDGSRRGRDQPLVALARDRRDGGRLRRAARTGATAGARRVGPRRAAGQGAEPPRGLPARARPGARVRQLVRRAQRRPDPPQRSDGDGGGSPDGRRGARAGTDGSRGGRLSFDATSRRSDELPVRDRLVVLGSGGFHPAYGRQTMCFLLHLDGAPLLLDAGTGLSRLGEADVARQLDEVERLDIVLSHYHLDHVVGLTYLSGVWRRPCRIFAPAPPLVDAEPAEALRRLIAPPLFPASLDQLPQPVEIVPYDGDFSVAGLEVRVRRQRHPGGSVGMRLGDRIAYVTDTACEAATGELAAGATWLLHEVWCDRAEAEEEPGLVLGHSAAEDVHALARECGAAHLVPVHHHPKRDARELGEFLDRLAATSVRSGDPVVKPLLDGQSVGL
ncbi:MAG: MBL fold metallo-hydrolase [Acidobacteria bacterium]|nr:MAG: MBL fold metallo-hydrolase [Acidobacteriota bacterium]